MGILVWMLLACGESATFEEPAAEPVVEAEAEPEAAPEGSEKAPELQAPIDARPDEVRVEAKAPEPGQAWPPIVVPEGPREREWEWDFKHKGSTKQSQNKAAERGQRDITLEEMNEIELADHAEVGIDPNEN